METETDVELEEIPVGEEEDADADPMHGAENCFGLDPTAELEIGVDMHKDGKSAGDSAKPIIAEKSSAASGRLHSSEPLLSLSLSSGRYPCARPREVPVHPK